MKLDRCIACVILLAALAGLPGVSAGQLQPPARPVSSDNPEVHWIHKIPPTAPLPPASAAPAPVSPSPATAQKPGDKSPHTPAKPRIMPIGARVAPTEPRITPAASGMPAAVSRVTLPELEGLALANNPTLVQAAMRIEAARGKCLQAGLYPNPTVGYQGEEIGAEGSAGQQGAFFAQEIVTAGKLGLRSAVAAWGVEQAEHAWHAQRRRVLNDVRSAWYEVLVAQRIAELNEQLVRIGQEGVKAAGDLLAAQEVSRVDELQARIEADSAKLQLHNARNRHLAAWRRLAAVLGTPHVEPAVLEGDLHDDLPQLSWEDALWHLLNESPELAEARTGIERARCALARESVQWVPNVNVQAGVQYHDAAEDAVAGVQVALPLPIFNRNQGNICRARAHLVAAEKEVQRIELALQDRLAAAFERYANARYQAKKYSAEILPNAKASLDLVRSGYRQGEHDYLTLLTAQRTFFRVNLAYLESLLEYHTSSVSIEGFLLSGGLGRVMKDE